MGYGYSAGYAANVAMGTAWAADVKWRKATVVRGKKVPIGTTGKVVWAGTTKFGSRVGLAVEGSTELVFVAAKNVKFGEKVPYTPRAAPAPATAAAPPTFAHHCEDEACGFAPTCPGYFKPSTVKASAVPKLAAMGF